MKYLRGFMMAWGCFCWIPCPYKKWNEEDRPAMLAMLPLVGTFMGAIVSLVWISLMALGVGSILTAVVVAAAYFLMTGFIHLDGYMDCCDAVLPRHPDVARRREILKDPHNGAFGIIALVLMFVVFIASICEITEVISREPGSIHWEITLIFPVMLTVSRGCGVRDVLSKKPMETSQYVRMKESDQGIGVAPIVTTVTVIIIFAAVDVFLNMKFAESYRFSLTLIAFGVTVVAASIAGELDRKSLGGMNGDISGHMIVTGEMFGLLATALVLHV